MKSLEKTIAENLRKIRKDLGKTQLEMAEHIRMSYGAYIKLENAQRLPRRALRAKMAKALGVSEESLLSQNKAPGTPEEAVGEAFQNMAALDPTKRELIMRILVMDEKEVLRATGFIEAYFSGKSAGVAHSRTSHFKK